MGKGTSLGEEAVLADSGWASEKSDFGGENRPRSESPTKCCRLGMLSED